MTIGERIKERRISLGISAELLASKLGIATEIQVAKKDVEAPASSGI